MKAAAELSALTTACSLQQQFCDTLSVPLQRELAGAVPTAIISRLSNSVLSRCVVTLQIRWVTAPICTWERKTSCWSILASLVFGGLSCLPMEHVGGVTSDIAASLVVKKNLENTFTHLSLVFRANLFASEHPTNELSAFQPHLGPNSGFQLTGWQQISCVRGTWRFHSRDNVYGCLQVKAVFMHQGIQSHIFKFLHAPSGNTSFILKDTPCLLGDTNKVAAGLAGG